MMATPYNYLNAADEWKMRGTGCDDKVGDVDSDRDDGDGGDGGDGDGDNGDGDDTQSST